MIRMFFKLLIVITAAWGFLYINNNWLQVTEYEINTKRLPPAFDGLTVVQLSDLHDATFGERQSALVNRVKQMNPDLIFLTGDLVDSNRYNLQNSLDLVDQLVDITNVFYVTGNHEVAVNQVEQITEALRARGVHVLMNDKKFITRNGETIAIVGIEDLLMKGEPDLGAAALLDEAMKDLPAQTYKLLLSHRPEVFDVYVDKQMDVVFTGHAHGGQFRLPGIGGLFAPGQGLFPTYTSGEHSRGITSMIVSRGLGNSVVPCRVFNRPEIVVATFQAAAE